MYEPGHQQPPQCLPLRNREEVSKLIKEMLQDNVIKPSAKSRVVLITNKDTSKRFCVDYRNTKMKHENTAIRYRALMTSWIFTGGNGRYS